MAQILLTHGDMKYLHDYGILGTTGGTILLVYHKNYEKNLQKYARREK
jgi:hypothetical protein